MMRGMTDLAPDGHHHHRPEIWAHAREAYSCGVGAPTVCEQFGLSLSTFRARARREGWRRGDLAPDPGAYRTEYDDFEHEVLDAAQMADTAWRMASNAMRRGRLRDAQGWTRLHRDLALQASAEVEARARREALAPDLQPEADAAASLDLALIALSARAISATEPEPRPALPRLGPARPSVYKRSRRPGPAEWDVRAVALTWAEWTEQADRRRRGFAAMLFDLDGTLVDTLPMHHRAYADVLAPYGVQLSYDQYKNNAAAPARISIPRFVMAAGGDPEALPPVADIHAAKKARFAELMGDQRLPRLPASLELELCAGRTPAALVTSANRAGAELIVASQGWTGAFETIVCGDDVGRGKPDPEPYLLAASRLGAAPESCLAFEDAPEGIAAALAAGMTVVDVVQREPIKAGPT
jgi:HAD superfamily hydrolase (TIGR01509 family)